MMRNEEGSLLEGGSTLTRHPW